MNKQIQEQLRLDSIAKWAEQCDQALALIRWQLLRDRLQQKASA